MLTDLRVRDLGVIEDLSLSIGPGLTALTGETGAGKTLLVEALQLVLGGRGGAGMVRSGAAEAFLEARFEVEDAPSANAPSANGPPANGPAWREVILARSVPASGRSRAWVDGRMTPVAVLAESGAGLVDIHGQREHHSLLVPAAQRRALDQFAGTHLTDLLAARRALDTIDERLQALGGDEGQRLREVDVLRHQLAEIEAARLDDVTEEVALAEEEDRLADLSALRDDAALALGSLDAGTDGQPGALDLVGRAVASLAGRGPFDAWEQRLHAVQAELADVASDLRDVVDTWEDDPERLAEVMARRRLLADLRRKYGPSLADVLGFAAAGRQRLADLEEAESAVSELSAARAAGLDALSAAELVVRGTRQQAAPRLARAVARRLGDLGMAGARLDVSVGQEQAGDAVRFELGANPGEPVLPLARVASGGELARAMLALRLVAMGGPATMVFDEVDAGVGGAAALALARSLREAAAGRQVLVVTHLAQVAAFADHQIAVHKRTAGGRTTTEATVLTHDERVVELSRMLSGHPDSVTARAHAEELLALGRAPAVSTTADSRLV